MSLGDERRSYKGQILAFGVTPLLWLLVMLCSLFQSDPLSAQTIERCQANCIISLQGRIALGVSYPETAGLDDVVAFPEKFNFTDQAHPALGYVNHPLWIRLSPAGDEAGKYLVVDNANLDHVTVFQNVVSGGWQSLTLGTHHAYHARPIRARSLVFPLSEHLAAGAPIYIKVKTQTSLSLPLYLASIDRLQEHMALRDTRAALFIGILLALSLYHVIIFLVVYDRTYLWFSFSSFFYVGYLLCIEGFTQQWLLQDSTSGVLGRLMLGCFFIASFFFYSFLLAILSGGRQVPQLQRLLKKMQWGFLVLLLPTFFISYTMLGPLSVVYSALATLVGIVVTLRLAWAGHFLARWFMAMWALFAFASLVRVLRLIGIGPAELAGEWVVQLISAIGFLFLAIALALRIRAMREAEHNALRRAMQVEQSANQLLEHKVAQRTRELRVEKHYLEYLADARNRFFAHANHEIRTPITAILQYVGFLQRGVGCRKPDAQEATYLDVVYQHAQRIHQLANQWLGQERLETLESLGSLENVALAPTIDAVLRRLAVIFEPGVKTSFDVMPGCEYAKGNHDYVECVLENLLSNAAKHTTEGSVLVRVEPGDHRHGKNDIRLCVIDTGSGVREEDRHRIFEPFQQGEGEKQEGAGLGLATCRVYVSRMGGEIGVTEAPGGGALFWFTLRAVE